MAAIAFRLHLYVFTVEGKVEEMYSFCLQYITKRVKVLNQGNVFADCDSLNYNGDLWKITLMEILMTSLDYVIQRKVIINNVSINSSEKQ